VGAKRQILTAGSAAARCLKPSLDLAGTARAGVAARPLLTLVIPERGDHRAIAALGDAFREAVLARALTLATIASTRAGALTAAGSALKRPVSATHSPRFAIGAMIWRSRESMASRASARLAQRLPPSTEGAPYRRRARRARVWPQRFTLGGIPMTIAFWCVLVAALLPYVPFGLASSKLNPHTPRVGAQALEGLAARAYGAHCNGFEAFPFFATAVIVAHLVEGANAAVDWLAVAFIVARLAHMAAYLMDRRPLRSTFFFIGLALTIVIFVHPAFH
jgi:uncharacterized MAPEG superfamily protein